MANTRALSHMSAHSSLALLHRITNCLQTILELEPSIERLELGEAMRDEFEVLKSYLSRLEDIPLREEDVQRIEHATEAFLREMCLPLAATSEADGARQILVDEALFGSTTDRLQ